MREVTYTNQDDLRAAFWEQNPDLVCRTNRRGNPLPQNQQPADTRMTFVDWIDMLQRDGQISEALAERATL
jgi:hypothetical protein